MPAVETKSSRINYAETGAGDPVVLIHCSSASGTEWTALCQQLQDQFRCVAPDQWNCGRSDMWPGHGPFTLSEEAEPIIEVIDRIGTPVHLVGHSYGGGVALRVARERPDSIRSLTLIEPSIFHILRHAGCREQELYNEISGVAQAVKQAIGTGDFWAGMGVFVDYWNGEGAWEAMPLEARMKLSQRLGKVVLDFRALFEEPASLVDYAALTPPTLIVCGDSSPAPSRRIVDMLAEAMPGARVQRIAGAGHMSPLTHPDAVNAAVIEHLERFSTDSRRVA